MGQIHTPVLYMKNGLCKPDGHRARLHSHWELADLVYRQTTTW